MTDVDQLARDIASAGKAVLGALRDVEDIERDSIGWNLDDVENAAQEAASALDALNDALDAAYAALPPVRAEREVQA